MGEPDDAENTRRLHGQIHPAQANVTSCMNIEPHSRAARRSSVVPPLSWILPSGYFTRRAPPNMAMSSFRGHGGHRTAGVQVCSQNTGKRTTPRAIPSGKNLGGARRVKEDRRNEEFLDARSAAIKWGAERRARTPQGCLAPGLKWISPGYRTASGDRLPDGPSGSYASIGGFGSGGFHRLNLREFLTEWPGAGGSVPPSFSTASASRWAGEPVARVSGGGGLTWSRSALRHQSPSIILRQ